MTAQHGTTGHPTTMKLAVLAINSGSSSVKAALIRRDGTHIATFLAEQLGSRQAVVHSHIFASTNDDDGAAGGKEHKQVQHLSAAVEELDEPLPNCQHTQALERIFDVLQQHNLMRDLVATGHRVVHGGTTFSDSVLVDDDTLQAINDVSSLAPLHNPHNVTGIVALRRILPDLPAIAVFDTSFHQTIPPKASLYPLPQSYRDKGIRKYGFHGTSVRFVAARAGEILGNPGASMIICHLGNGASVSAVANQVSVETSMGFSPLEGLMMGTRSGSIDPAVVSFAVHAFDKSVDDVLDDLNKNSGLKAMANGESDMRIILRQAKAGSEEAQLAVDMFVYRVVQHIASCAVALPGPADVIVFTGGIGEHAAEIRRDCIRLLQQTLYPSLELNEGWNQQDGSESLGYVTEKRSKPISLVIATDEEAIMARDCFRLIGKQEA
jgi:acetate kinase